MQSAATNEEVVATSRAWCANGRSEIERQKVAATVEPHAMAMLSHCYYWLGEIAALGFDPTEMEAGALLVRYMADPKAAG